MNPNVLREDDIRGWGLVQASNSQPLQVLRFEANDQRIPGEMQEIFMDKLAEKGVGIK